MKPSEIVERLDRLERLTRDVDRSVQSAIDHFGSATMRSRISVVSSKNRFWSYVKRSLHMST